MIRRIAPSYTMTRFIFKPYALLLAGVCVLVGWFGDVPFAAAQLSTEEMQQRKAMWREYAMSKEINYCIDVTPGERMTKHGDYPPDGLCGIGDSVKLNALLCFAGEQFACQAVKNSMDDNGRLWRSPVHARPQGWPHAEWKNGRLDYPTSATDFSRDHMLGFLLYLAVTKDTAAARKWLAWLNSTDARLSTVEFVEGLSEDVAREVANGVECLTAGVPCITYQQTKEAWEDLTRAEKIACGLITGFEPLGICPAVIRNGKKLTKRGEIPKYITLFMPRVCDDISCELTPDLYALMYDVFNYLGLLEEVRVQALLPGHPASQNMILFRLPASVSERVLVTEVKGVPEVLEGLKGYQLGLKAITALLKYITRSPMPDLVRAVHDRDPDNPFHQYLLRRFADLNAYTLEGMRQHVFGMCPATIEDLRQDLRPEKRATFAGGFKSNLCIHEEGGCGYQ